MGSNQTSGRDSSLTFSGRKWSNRKIVIYVVIALVILVCIIAVIVGLAVGLQQTELECGDLTKHPGQGVSGNTRQIGSTVVVTCESGFWTTGRASSATLTCTDFGNAGGWTWNQTVCQGEGCSTGEFRPLSTALCQAIQCPDLRDKPQIKLNSNLRNIGSKVKVTCDDGYTFPDGTTSTAVTCLLDGQWDNTSVLVCYGSCEFLSKVETDVGLITNIQAGENDTVFVSSTRGIEILSANGESRQKVANLDGWIWSATDIGNTIWAIDTRATDGNSSVISQYINRTRTLYRQDMNGMWHEELENEIQHPFRLDKSKQGELVVLDAKNRMVYWIQTTPTVTITHTTDLNLTAGWVSMWEMAVLPNNNLAILDDSAYCVRIISKNGAFLHTAGECGNSGSDPWLLQKPKDITATSDGLLLVSDDQGDRISVFGSDGVHLKDICQDHIKNPTRIAAVSQDKIWIEELWDLKILRINLKL